VTLSLSIFIIQEFTIQARRKMSSIFSFVCIFLIVFIGGIHALNWVSRKPTLLTSAAKWHPKTSLNMADIEITFPNNKKVKAASGSSLKEAAKKAGFTPNYGCEEGKCGSCELKLNGKQKIRPCIGKVCNN
jgi:ferredoxin